MLMKIQGNIEHRIGKRDPMLYGHFIEHFHRQIYGGVYDPESPLADENGFRRDVLQAMRDIQVPILRWPGGCFVSSYHWQDGVGSERKPSFDKAWRVEEPNTFGTAEYIRLCREVGCEPYICTNAGTGTAEEMSDWVEYCNLESEGRFARQRKADDQDEPYGVKFWSIGNENYGFWEIGAKTPEEWGCLTREAAKMMKHVDPRIELSAAALTDLDWNVKLLKNCGPYLDWISIHDYWDPIHETNEAADYEGCMAFTADIGASVRKVRGLLSAMGLEKKIRIAYDEWNLRQWYHPGVHSIEQALTREEYLRPRDDNDINAQYTMADAVFSAVFLNMCLRNCDIVGMANFAPVVNTRGCIYTYPEGIVLRSTYFVFYLFTRYMGDIVIDSWESEVPEKAFRSIEGKQVSTALVDTVLTTWETDHAPSAYALSAVNKDPDHVQEITIDLEACGKVTIYTIAGRTKDSYNDIDRTEIEIVKTDAGRYEKGMTLTLPAHSVNVIQIENREGEET